MITDCHVHWSSPEAPLAATDPSRLLGELDRHGIGRAVLMPNLGLMRADACRAENDDLAAVMAQAPGRILSVGTSWPKQGAEAIEEARRCLADLGLKGLKYHPWVQGFSTADPTFAEICRVAARFDAPLIFHDGTPCYCTSEQIAGLARRFPETTFVLGHSGILWNWRSALEASRWPNIWPCLCSPHIRAVETFAKQARTDRLLWGSDWTGRPGPGADGSIEYRLGVVLEAQMDEETRRSILSDNAACLFPYR